MPESEQQRSGRRFPTDEGGFTLIEVLIIVVVLGIMAAVVVFFIQGVTGQSAQSACNADARTVSIAAIVYETQTGNTIPPADGTTVTESQDEALLVGSYLHSWPKNPNHYTIAFSTTAPGTITVTPRGGSVVNFDAESAIGTPTGCFAVS